MFTVSVPTVNDWSEWIQFRTAKNGYCPNSICLFW